MAKTTDPKTPPTDEHAGHNHDHAGHDHSGHSHAAPATRHPEVGEDVMVNFSIAWDKIKVEYQKQIQRYQPQIKTSGFRQGKAPLSMVEQMVGAQRLYQDAVEKLLPAAYVEAIKAGNYQPISDPEIHASKMDEGKDWEFHAHIAQKPTITLGKYQAVIKKALADFDKTEESTAKSAKGGSAKDVKADDKAVAEPAKTEETPEQLRDRKLQAILAALRDSIKPIIPELLIKQEAQRQLDQLARQMEAFNIKIDSYLQSLGKTPEEIQTEYAGRALAAWQLEVIIDAVAIDQKIDATDADIDKTIKDQNGDPEKTSADYKAQVKSLLRKEKVFEYLLNVQ